MSASTICGDARAMPGPKRIAGSAPRTTRKPRAFVAGSTAARRSRRRRLVLPSPLGGEGALATPSGRLLETVVPADPGAEAAAHHVFEVAPPEPRQFLG